ncbi:MAG TPA: hypothetical protein VJ600_03390, partial [Holophagaceae bacterium]|nr:hypothetical protein [Holophagaceae bacterium]
MKSVTRIALALAAAAAMAAPLAPEARVASVENMLARRAAFGLNADHGFALRSAQSDELGQAHARFQQTYRGVKVFGGEVVAHNDATGRQRFTNALYKNINLNVSPSIDKAEALATAHREMAPKGAYANEPKAELVVFPVTAQTQVGKGEGALSFRDEVVRFTLAYHVHAELENGAETSHMDYMVDAHTGAILDKWSSLETAAATGSGNSQYSGNVSINTNSISGGYEMRDTVRGMNYATYNLNHATSGQGTIYTDADNGWGDGANYVEGSSTTAANGQTAAVDAHYGVGLTYDYYKNIHGRNGIDGNGTATYSRVHYSNSYDNA